ncbi:MAG: sulfite exporter TauE/SafE family protein [Bdellovibrionales bacterium]|nr:sulfite exporter TauE/SafE family protein [Bdellovibrionales bacterium]
MVAMVAGAFGALLGLGGGFILIPFLTLVLGVHIHYAIGASLVSVIATSSGAAASYVRDRMTNVRVAILLEIGTTLGAITGATLASRIEPSGLFLLFSILLVWSAFAMLRRREGAGREMKVPPDALADRLRLHSEYPGGTQKEMIPYRVARAKLGIVLMYFAGCVSALLGIGSGILKVPAMDQAMRIPIKVSSATSNFMIGVTTATSAGIYFMRGDIIPGLAGPIAFGVLIGSQVGSRWLGKWSGQTIRFIFVIILILVAVEMGIKGVQSYF